LGGNVMSSNGSPLMVGTPTCVGFPDKRAAGGTQHARWVAVSGRPATRAEQASARRAEHASTRRASPSSLTLKPMSCSEPASQLA
jgi:hypothetical protein